MGDGHGFPLASSTRTYPLYTTLMLLMLLRIKMVLPSIYYINAFVVVIAFVNVYYKKEGHMFKLNM